MNVRKRGLALLMCICMIFTLLPFSVFAEDGAVNTEKYVSDNSENANQSGVSMTKTVTKVDDDTYTVTLEQYVKDTINAGKTTPVDVVLVLDVSGSMAESGITSTEYQKVFNVNKYSRAYYIYNGTDYVGVEWCGYCQAYAEVNKYEHSTTYMPKTSENDTDETHVQFYTRIEGAATTKLKALQNAVNSFIGTIAAKNPESKIAIVKFAGKETKKVGNDTYSERYIYNYTQIVKSLTAVNSEENVQELKAAVNALTAAGATQADYGMEKAKEVFGTESATPGRQRFVIMFTDGEPTSSSGFETSVADNTISAANDLENSYGAKVYTIAVHKNAKVGTELPATNSGDDRINRYMHLVSSNYPNATSLENTGEGSVTNGYYKVATNEAELSDAFTQIGNSTSEAAVKGLDSTAVVTDDLAKNFQLPDGADTSNIKVYTAAYNGDGAYSDREEFDDASVSIGKTTDGNTYVAVSGFDYSANYVSDIAHQGDADNFGKKLIVEFTIIVDRDKTYGGTQPTNAGANITLSNTEYASVKNPTVPVAITNGFSCKYTYVQDYNGKGINVKEHFINMLGDDGLSTESSKNEYVAITYTITHEEDGVTVTDGTYVIPSNQTTGSWKNEEAIFTNAAVGTYTYDVTCSVADANGKAGYADGAKDGTGTMTFTINPIDGLALDVNGAGYNGVYDGNSHGSAAAATVNGVETDKATILYSTDNGDTWTPDYPTATNVLDSTTVRVRASLPGYNNAEAEYALTVSKRPVKFTASTVTRTWTGEEIAVNNTDDSDVTITASAPTAEAPNAGLLQDNNYSFGGTVYTASGTDETTGQGNAGRFVSDAAAKLTIEDGQGSDVTANYALEFVVGYLKIAAPGSAETVLTAVKNYDGKPAESAYTFELKNEAGKVLQTKQNANDGTVTFDALTFDKKGTFTYYISEVKGPDKGIVYDETVYKVEIEVTLAGDSYSAETNYYKVVNNELEPVGEIVFNNTTAPATLVVGKTVSGNVSTSTEFGFRVELADTTYNKGGFTEGAISFTLKAGESNSLSLPGNAAYTVKELDSSNYTVTATVNGEAAELSDGALSGIAAAGETVTVSFNNYKAFPPAPKTALTITAGSAEGYGPDPVTCDKWTVEGLKTGDSVDSVTITGKQSVPGSSANVASNAVIKNAAGQDVTADYDIKYVDGTLTMIEILNKEIHFNYIVGYTDGTIRPENNISRAEIAAIFFRLLNDDVRDKFNTTDCDFSDVAEGSWCRRSIATLTSLGVISGYTDGTFRPDAEITRAELATIISRFANLDVNTQTFSDISGHWAQKYIELAAGNGWIKGYEDGTFRPDEKITRAETFAMINRVLNRQTENVTDLLPQSEMNMWSDNMDEDAWYYKDVQEATNYHKCERIGDSVYEKWTEKVPDIDWAKVQL